MYGNFEEEDQEYVLVDLIDTFHSRALIPVPKGKTDWAFDTITMDEHVEFSSRFLDTNIVSHRVITREEAIRTAREDNTYAENWNETQICQAFFTPPINENGEHEPKDFYINR